MQAYFSTFVSGTGSIVEEALKKKLPRSIKILFLLDGLIAYETSYSTSDIANIRFFNNSFISLKLFRNLGPNPIDEMIKEAIRDPRLGNQLAFIKNRKIRTFKIMTSLENTTVSANRFLIKKMEAKISQFTGFRLDIKNPDMEFWFLARSEKIGLFGARITYRERRTEKGQLKPELAHMLCLASGPNSNDVFLDPFAGSGAIPMEISASFPYKKIIVIDNQKNLVEKLKKKFGKNMKDIMIRQGNALHLPDVSASSINKVVTDPPWGIYEETKISISEFYYQMLKEFYRALKPDGIAVLLIGNKVAFEEAFKKFRNEFILLSKYNILVSGKKANIYKLKKYNKEH